MVNPPPIPTEAAPLLLCERDAAIRLGVSPATLARVRRKGEIPHKRIGARVLYHPDELADWAKSLGSVEGRRAEEPIGSR